MGESAGLPVTTLVSLIQRENLGEPHPVLAGGERYVSPRFATDVWVGDAIRDAVRLVQRAWIEYYGWITDGGETFAVLVAASGRTAVTLVRAGDRAWFERADPERAVHELVQRLPIPAGRGDSISIRAADYHPPKAAGRGVLLEAASARSQQARRLDALLRAERIGGARLYTAKRDRPGIRRRAEEWINVLHLAGHGGWAVYTSAGRGERAINAVPATPRLLADRLTELNRSLT